MSAPERLRVPQQDGAVIAVPALANVPEVLARNRKLLGRAGGNILDLTLQELRREAREATVAAAREYLSAAGEPVPEFNADSLLLSGHQPELFHPGVWVKNFALHRLAFANGATPLNLIVDNDTAKSTLLRVPTDLPDGEGEFRIESVPFDHWGEEAPYEERPVRDERLLASVPERVRSAAADWGFEPMLTAFWDAVREHSWRTNLLGESFAASRRIFERAWGCHNLELPVSRLCQTEPFAWFACHLLRELPRFHRLYNEAVHRYRQRYGIRSRSHPVPDLAAEGEWLEAPFWAWRRGQHRRGRLMVRPTSEGLELRVGAERWPGLSHDEPAEDNAVWQFQALQRAGYNIRSRALTNTLYARVFLADLFIHGIGGGKYDELTDELIRDFYGIEPPRFMVLSATLLLPFPQNREPVEDCRGPERRLRDVHWNPQRYLSPQSGQEVARLLAEKQAWIAKEPPTRRGRRERFRTLQRLTAELRPHAEVLEAQRLAELELCQRRRSSAAVLRRRDYAFCLYPEAQLRAFCTRFLQPDGAA